VARRMAILSDQIAKLRILMDPVMGM
jgi:hypothetical protein